MRIYKSVSISVVIPCLNEEIALPIVIDELREVLPNADIWVYDNGSTDGTVRIAEEKGVNVRKVLLRGKGYALIQAFADLSSDYIVVLDGDATYEAKAINKLLDTAIDQKLDMVTGVRKSVEEEKAYRFGHVWGNKFFTGLVKTFFGDHFDDLLSGYRVFSKRYYKSFAYLIKGFDIETYLTVHALNLAMPIGDVETLYKERPEGSHSKLRTYRDGFKVMFAILKLIVHEKPFLACNILAFLFFTSGFSLGFSLLPEYISTGLVPRFPTAILCTLLICLSAIAFICGVLLHYILKNKREFLRLQYAQLGEE